MRPPKTSRLPAASAAEGTEPLQNLERRSVGVRVIPRPAKIATGEGKLYLDRAVHDPGQSGCAINWSV